jgi:hypothetical protein
VALIHKDFFQYFKKKLRHLPSQNDDSVLAVKMPPISLLRQPSPLVKGSAASDPNPSTYTLYL